jgi:hypothetical protein
MISTPALAGYPPTAEMYAPKTRRGHCNRKLLAQPSEAEREFLNILRRGFPMQALVYQPENLQRHFEKHGRDFAARNPQQYEQMALELAASTSPTTVYFQAKYSGYYFKIDMSKWWILIVSPDGQRIVSFYSVRTGHSARKGLNQMMYRRYIEPPDEWSKPVSW